MALEILSRCASWSRARASAPRSCVRRRASAFSASSNDARAARSSAATLSSERKRQSEEPGREADGFGPRFHLK